MPGNVSEPLNIIKVELIQPITEPLVGKLTGTRYGKRRKGERLYIREKDFTPALFKRV